MQRRIEYHAQDNPSMCNWFKRAGVFVSAHVGSIIAISSLLIARFSLYLTIDAQRSDRLYKELLIKPSLALGADSTSFSFFLQNDGLGPADIKSIVYYFNNHCLYLVQSDRIRVNRENANEVSVAIKDRLYDRIFSIPSFAPLMLNADLVKVHPLLPGTIIGSGRQWVFFAPDEPFMEIRKRISELEPHFAQSLRDTFLLQGMTLPFSLRYCSMSGNFCETSARSESLEVPCKLEP
jgi:hypothetical protein